VKRGSFLPIPLSLISTPGSPLQPFTTKVCSRPGLVSVFHNVSASSPVTHSLVDPAFMPQPSGNMASAGVVMGPVDDAAF
jgi:hypothetical protein